MAVINCKMCGSPLPMNPGVTVVECEYCGREQTVPSMDNEKKLTLFARAERLRAACEFDKAFAVFESIVAEFPKEAEAYWGLVLCKYGIEYVGDPRTGEKVPTCHRSSFESVMDDLDYEQALVHSDAISRQVYCREARRIEEIRKGIVWVSSKETPYDVFICYKESDHRGGRTLDSVIAQDIYNMLTQKGYRVFFSRITLEDKLGLEFEPYIFAALNSAKLMLVIGTEPEYLNAVWVRNEWSRFLKLMAKDSEKRLFPVYKNIMPSDLPREFQRLQALDYGKLGADQDLMHGIEKILPRKQETPAVTPPVAPQPIVQQPAPQPVPVQMPMVYQPVQIMPMTAQQHKDLQKVVKNVKLEESEKQMILWNIEQGGRALCADVLANCKMKSPGVALLLAIFFGMFGVDRFYLGQKTYGIVKLVLGFIGYGVILMFVDWLLIKNATRKANRVILFNYLRSRDLQRFGGLPQK
jgi:TM2 domain-containing membrane protein YozV